MYFSYFYFRQRLYVSALANAQLTVIVVVTFSLEDVLSWLLLSKRKHWIWQRSSVVEILLISGKTCLLFAFLQPIAVSWNYNGTCTIVHMLDGWTGMKDSPGLVDQQPYQQRRYWNLLLRTYIQQSVLLNKGTLAKRSMQQTISVSIMWRAPYNEMLCFNNLAMSSQRNAVQTYLSIIVECIHDWSITNYSSNKTMSVTHYFCSSLFSPRMACE